MKTLLPLFAAFTLATSLPALAQAPCAATAPGCSAAAMRDISSVALSKLMTPGVNLGNTLEALPNETAWGAPLTSQATMDGFKAAGFKSVRIPVAWSQYADADHNIQAKWMARVKQVVDYAHRADLYVIINVHWDGGWMDHPDYEHRAAITAKLTKFWNQIAATFKDYDDHLLFAGSNEVGMQTKWGVPIAPEWAEVQNGFNQTFVDVVRASGGNNARRHLVVQAYFTSIDSALKINTVPKDSIAQRLFMEVHYYDPYNFALNGKGDVWQWGALARDPKVTETWADEPWVDDRFAALKRAFVDKGVGVIVGEYGAYAKARFPEMKRYTEYWAAYVTRSMVRNGLVPMWWDTGGLIDRVSGRVREPALTQILINASRTAAPVDAPVSDPLLH